MPDPNLAFSIIAKNAAGQVLAQVQQQSTALTQTLNTAGRGIGRGDDVARIFQGWGVAANDATRSSRLLESGLSQLAAHAAGLPGPFGRIAEAVVRLGGGAEGVFALGLAVAALVGPSLLVYRALSDVEKTAATIRTHLEALGGPGAQSLKDVAQAAEDLRQAQEKAAYVGSGRGLGAFLLMSPDALAAARQMASSAVATATTEAGVAALNRRVKSDEAWNAEFRKSIEEWEKQSKARLEIAKQEMEEEREARLDKERQAAYLRTMAEIPLGPTVGNQLAAGLQKSIKGAKDVSGVPPNVAALQDLIQQGLVKPTEEFSKALALETLERAKGLLTAEQYQQAIKAISEAHKDATVEMLTTAARLVSGMGMLAEQLISGGGGGGGFLKFMGGALTTLAGLAPGLGWGVKIAAELGLAGAIGGTAGGLWSAIAGKGKGQQGVPIPVVDSAVRSELRGLKQLTERLISIQIGPRTYSGQNLGDVMYWLNRRAALGWTDPLPST